MRAPSKKYVFFQMVLLGFGSIRFDVDFKASYDNRLKSIFHEVAKLNSVKHAKSRIGVVENDHRQSCMLTLLRCASNAAITFSVSICFCVIRAHVEKYAKCLIVLHF